MASPWNLLVFAIAGDATELKEMQSALAAMRAALTTTACQIGMQLVTAAGAKRYWITTQDKQATSSVSGTIDASDPTCLSNFLVEAAHRLGDHPTALVVFAHGSGLDRVVTYRQTHGHLPISKPHDWPLHFPIALPSPYRLGPDPTSAKFLSNVGLRDAIKGSKVDVLAINACWMADLEIIYELRKVCTVVVASQVFAEAWDYGDLVTQLCTQPVTGALALGKRIVARVQSQIDANKRDDALSASRADKLDAFVKAFDAFAVAAIPLVGTNWSGVKAALGKVQRLDDPMQADVGSLLQELAGLVGAAANTAHGLYTKVMIANAVAAGTHPGLTGLSVLCPDIGHVDTAAAYDGLDFASNHWATFLKLLETRLPTP